MNKNERDVLVFAIRYSLTRHTCALSICIDMLKDNIDDFEDWELKVLSDDIRNEIIYQNNNVSQEVRNLLDYICEEIMRRLNEE